MSGPAGAGKCRETGDELVISTKNCYVNLVIFETQAKYIVFLQFCIYRSCAYCFSNCSSCAKLLRRQLRPRQLRRPRRHSLDTAETTVATKTLKMPPAKTPAETQLRQCVSSATRALYKQPQFTVHTHHISCYQKLKSQLAPCDKFQLWSNKLTLFLNVVFARDTCSISKSTTNLVTKPRKR